MNENRSKPASGQKGEPPSTAPHFSLSFSTVNGVLTLGGQHFVGPGTVGMSRRALGTFEADELRFEIVKYLCIGPREPDSERRAIGIFGGIHGDERAGTLICESLLRRFAQHPYLFSGYELHIYPALNPWGLVFNCRENAKGKDLNRLFWCESEEPEIRLVEEELRKQRLDGLIGLHTDADSEGVYGYTQGRMLSSHLLEPALEAAGEVLPVNLDAAIDGFHAAKGMISKCFPGILRPPPPLRGWPFEIILETPGKAHLGSQVTAGTRAVLAILEHYRVFLSHSWGI